MSTRSRDFNPPAFHPDRPGLVLPVRADPRGLTGPTGPQTKNRGWRRTSYRYYLPARYSDADPLQRIVEASVVVPHGGAVTGWAAVAWLDHRGWFDGLDSRGERLPVPLQVPHRRIRRQHGMRLVSERLLPGDIGTVDGLPVVRPERAIVDEMRRASSLGAAVAWLDLACITDVVSIADVRGYLERMTGTWAGLERAALATDLALENVWSPPETEMRLLWRSRGGFQGELLANVPIFGTDGTHLGTPDLFDPESGLVGEYDGPQHLELGQRSRDLTREGRLRSVGLEMVVMMASDRRDPTDYLSRLGQARGRGLARSGAPRAWTLEKPSYWRSTETVAQRRALPVELRERFLRRPPASSFRQSA